MFFSLIRITVILLAVTFAANNAVTSMYTFMHLPVKGDFVIEYDPGGYTYRYVQQAKYVSEHYSRVVIDGLCASACILYLHSTLNLKVCATERGQVGFHMPYKDDENGLIDKSEEAQAQARLTALSMISGLPKKLAIYFFPLDKLPNVAEGARISDMIIVKGKELQEAIGAC